MSAFVIIYAFVGMYMYADDRTAASLQYGLAFGALPAGTVLTTLIAFGLARRNPREDEVAVGWPISTLFWWLLPLGLSISFALIALLGFGPIAQKKHDPVGLLVVAHGLNGVVLGFTLWLMPPIFRLIPRRDGS